MEKNKIAYDGLEEIEEIKYSSLVDILSGDELTREKLSEVIKKVNIIIAILNERIGK